VRAYPRSFRDAVGADLADALHDRMAARRQAGASRANVVLRALFDTARNAPGAWGHALRDAIRDRPPAASRDRDGERTMIDKLRQDFRYAIRTWRRRPGFAIVALVTLALGIGANTALFSIVNAVLLRPLPYAHADRLVTLWGKTPSNPQSLISYPEFDAFRRDSASFDALAVWLGNSVNLTGVSEPQRLLGAFASGSFFDVLGLKAERGRLFTDQDSEPGSVQPVVVISHDFWQRRFAGDPSAIGATLTINAIPLTVIGVLAPPFDVRSVPSDGWFLGYDVYIPVGHFPVPGVAGQGTGSGGLMRAGPSMLSVGRVKPGVSMTSAQADLDVISRRLEAAFPDAQKGRSTQLASVQETVVAGARTPLLLLLASVGAVLLIACVNVSNLLLARAVDREKEIALRAALGASRLAVTRQLLVEATLLAAVAATAGLALGRWSLQTLTWLRPPSVPIPDRIPLDSTVLLFTTATGLAVAVLCGVLPAWRASRLDLNRALQAGFRRASGGGGRTRDVLVVVEVALSVALLAVSGLLVQSLLAAQRVQLGFDTGSVLTLQFRLPQSKYQSPQQIARFFTQALERVRSAPGVTAAALVRRVPFSGNWGDTPFTIEGGERAAASAPRAGQNMISPGYFQAMRIPLVRGRDFTDRDDLAAPGAVIVNQTLARVVWPNEDPIGKRLKVPESPEWLTVVGVVGDVKHRSPGDRPQPQLYLPHYQVPLIFSSLVARTAVPPMNVANDVRKAIWSVDKDQPVWTVRPLDELVASSHGPARFLASLLALFAGVALVLAAVGIYGVMSYAVAQRTHEIGIRLALGASGSRVRREVVARGLWLTAGAVVLGLIAAVGLGRAAQTVLFDVKPSDPVSLAAAAAILGVVSLAACYVPARRASKVDPVIALTEE